MEMENILEMQSLLDELKAVKMRNIREKAERIDQFIRPILEKWIQNEAKEEPKEPPTNEKYLNGFNPNASIQQMVSLLGQATKQHEKAYDYVGEQDRKTQDILHSLELLENGENELLQLSKELKEIRQERRKAKNQREVLEPFKQFLDVHTDLLPNLKEIQKRMRKIEEQQGNRSYAPRELTAMEQAFQKAKEKKTE